MTDTLTAAFEALQERLRELDAERGKVRKAIEAMQPLIGASDRRQISLLDSDEQPGLSGSPTYAEAAEAVLTGMRRPLHIAPILNALNARWFPDKDPDDRNFSNAVYAAMDRRDDVFVKTGPATFGLKAWVQKNGTAPAETGAAQ